jgi:hypothetical protein
VTATILIPPTGKSLNLKHIYFSATNIDVVLNHWQFAYTGPVEIWSWQPDPTSVAGVIYPFDFSPDGITLPINASLLFKNLNNTSALGFSCIVQYGLI